MGLYGLGATTNLISSLADSITRMEGYILPGTPGYPNGSLAYQNSNPGNIRFVQNGYNYPGATLGAGGFAKYPDIATGRAALEHQIGAQVSKGQNLTQFFNQYAPPSENDTRNYINTVATQVGVDPSVPLTNYLSGQVNGGSTYVPTDTYDLSPDPSGIEWSYLSDGSVVPYVPSTDGLDTPTTIALGIGAVGLLYALFG